MTVPLEHLYHQQMVALTQTPRYKNENPLINMVTLRNPMCGDVISMGYLGAHDIYWNGDGCLICLASAEALCQIVAESDAHLEICAQIEAFFKGEKETLVEKFMPLSSVKMTPTRIKCVMLAVSALRKLITTTKAL